MKRISQRQLKELQQMKQALETEQVVVVEAYGVWEDLSVKYHANLAAYDLKKAKLYGGG